MAKESKSSINTINVDRLHPDPEQPRTHFDEKSLQELADSIKAQELLYPILYREVNEDEEAKFIIVDGERRWRAYKILERKEIPAIKFEGDHEAVALIGNIVREDLTAMEEALAVNKLKSKLKEKDENKDKGKEKDKEKITNEKLGKILGKGESTISEILALMKLPDYIQSEVKDKREWSRVKLLKLTKKRKDSTQKALFERMRKEILQIKSNRDKKDKIITAKNQIEFLKSKLVKIETEEKWTSDDKKALKQHLNDLKAAIDKMMKGL